MAFPDIMSMFRSNPTTPPVTPAPTGDQTPGQPLQGTQASQVTAPNGMIPTQSTPAPDSLEAFADVWKVDPATVPQEPASVFAGLTPQKIYESAQKVDFSKSISPEILQRIQGGGQDAIAALSQSMNSVAQNVFAQSTLATTKIVEQALAKQSEQYDARIPTMVKKFSTNENILADNPLLQNPAIQPLVGALQEQLIRKNPNASPTEIQRQVQDYFSALGNSMAPKPATQKATPAAEDWEKFFN